MRQALSISRHGVDLDPWFIVIYSTWEIILLLRWRRIAASILSCRQVHMENRQPISFNSCRPPTECANTKYQLAAIIILSTFDGRFLQHVRPCPPLSSVMRKPDSNPQSITDTPPSPAAFSQTMVLSSVLYTSKFVSCLQFWKQAKTFDTNRACCPGDHHRQKSNWYQLALLVSHTSK